MRSVPVPGEILRTDIIAGLSFSELVVLGSIPLVVVLPALFIQEIPLIGAGIITVVTTVLVIIAIIRAPEGQTPVEWAPHAFQRRFNSDAYYLKPKQQHRTRPVYQDRIKTHDQLQEERENPDDPVDIEEDGLYTGRERPDYAQPNPDGDNK